MKMVRKTKQTKEKQFENIDRVWKDKNKKYLTELQLFLDKVESIEDGELRKSIIRQMLICDNTLTEIAEDMFIDFYEEGYKKGKQG